MITELTNILNKKLNELENLWMSQLYAEQREYDKQHLLYPKNF